MHAVPPCQVAVAAQRDRRGGVSFPRAPLLALRARFRPCWPARPHASLLRPLLQRCSQWSFKICFFLLRDKVLEKVFQFVFILQNIVSPVGAGWLLGGSRRI